MKIFIFLLVLALTQAQVCEAARPKVALVLSGGGGRGASHVGVLKALEENKIPVDCIVGTSMGAIIGGLYASGMPPSEIERLLNSVDWNDLFTDRPSRRDLSFRRKQIRKDLIDFEVGFNKGKFILPKGLIAGQKLGFLLKSKTLSAINAESFDELPIPFRAVAADLETGEMVVLGRGNLAEAIRASMSIPGAFTPVEINSRVLVDGGVVRNLPIDVAKEMGADVIIAVNVSTPLEKLENLKTAVDITMQTLGILTIQNVKDQIKLLTDKDILITPELGDISTTDFSRSEEAIHIGELETRKSLKDLQRYAAPDEEYQLFIARQRKADVKPVRIDFVKVNETKRVAKQAIEQRIKTKPGEQLDLEVLKADLTRVYAIGDFQQVDFNVIKEDSKKGLVIDTKEKSWGPGYARFGLNISDDFEGSSFYNFITEYARTQINDKGAEWKNRIQLGRDTKLASEFYQPLDYADRFFVQPNVLYDRNVTDIYSGNDRIAQYRANYLGAGVDTGVNFGTFAQAKAGIERGKAKAGPIVGDTALPKFDIDQAALTGSFAFDQIDDSNFPRYGIAADTNIFATQKAFGADDSYRKLGFGFTKATSYNKHTLLADAQAGFSPDEDTPFYDEFTLGGFLSLSGYSKGQLRGQHSGLGRLIYYYKLADMPLGWLDSIYAGGSFESGNVWNKKSDAKFDNLLYAGSVFVGVDNVLGPLYIGYGIAEDSEDGKVYLFLGQTF